MPIKPTAEQAREAGRAIVEDRKPAVVCRPAIVDKAGGTIRNIAKEHTLIAFSDIADFCTVDDGGAMKVKTFEEMGKKRRAIRKIREKTTISESADGQVLHKNSVVEIELWDKVAALKALDDMRCDKVQKVQHDGQLTVKVVNFGSNDPA